MHGRKLRLYVLTICLGLILFASGCAQQTPPDTPSDTAIPTEATSIPVWMDFELKDVITGETFKISDFAGRPVLLESFAVWCPTCTVQQIEMGNLKQSKGESIVHISVNTDPNEDEERVKEHLERHGFDWYFAIAPIEFTNALIDEFGFNVVYAPRAPVVLICGDQTTRFLRGGIKREAALFEEIEKGCQ
jgi:cytochrome oxidase Cu insertion factor (SCO1/SenC/PrrC family)